MQPRTLVPLPIVLVAILAAAPACAQLYKWVDGRGVTNYSNQPPADPEAARTLALVEDRLSVYTPDRALAQAVEASRKRSDQALAERIDSLERQLEAERRARQYSAAPAVHDPCLSQGINCNGNSGYYPYDPAFAFVPVRHRPRRIVQPQLTPGMIAGNVVGLNGFMPGNSAAASIRPALSSRPLLEAPMSRGSRQGSARHYDGNPAGRR